MPRLVDIRRGNDARYYVAVVQFSTRAYRVIRYHFSDPPRLNTDLYRTGEKFRTKRTAMLRLGELAECTHRVYQTRAPDLFICVVPLENDTFGVYEAPEHQYPQESGRLLRRCPTYRYAIRFAEREVKKHEIQIQTAPR